MINNTNTVSIDTFCQDLDEQKMTSKQIILQAIGTGMDFYWHPLGFIMGTYLTENEKSIRIHIWPNCVSRQQEPYWNIHDHIFEFKSWVIKGKILHQQFKITDDKNSPHYIYGVEYINGISMLRRTSKQIGLVRTDSTIISKGSTYSMEAGTLHSSENIGNETALTVLLAIKKTFDNPIVIGVKSGKLNYTFYRSKVDSEYFTNLLSEL